jgi:AraC-like DNA-binding protein
MAANGHDYGEAVQRIVAALLPEGRLDIHLVSEVVRLSPRTLQRRLHAEGLTFAGVVARTRFAQAVRMLDDPTRKVIEVALDLGYSDPAHFTRAFERWTGLTPREYRRRGGGHDGT